MLYNLVSVPFTKRQSKIVEDGGAGEHMVIIPATLSNFQPLANIVAEGTLLGTFNNSDDNTKFYKYVDGRRSLLEMAPDDAKKLYLEHSATTAVGNGVGHQIGELSQTSEDICETFASSSADEQNPPQYRVNLAGRRLMNDVFIETTLDKPHHAVYLPHDITQLSDKVLDQLNTNRVAHLGYLEECQFFSPSTVSTSASFFKLTEYGMIELGTLLDSRCRMVRTGNGTKTTLGDSLLMRHMDVVVNLSEFDPKLDIRVSHIKFVKLPDTCQAIWLPSDYDYLSDSDVLALHVSWQKGASGGRKRGLFRHTKVFNDMVAMDANGIVELTEYITERVCNLRKEQEIKLKGPDWVDRVMFNEFPVLDTVRGVQVVLDYTSALKSNDNKLVIYPSYKHAPLDEVSIVVLPPVHTVGAIVGGKQELRSRGTGRATFASTCAVMYFDDENGYVVERDRDIRRAILSFIDQTN